MGCITSKHGGSVVAASPVSVVHNNSHGLIFASSSSSKQQSGRLESNRDDEKLDDNGKTINHHHRKSSRELRKSKRGSSSRKSGSFSLKLGFSHRFVEAEQVAAGWPAWLSSAAGEAVHGWVPLQAEAFEKLDKIGQGTYSSVFQAREVETGRMVALKKVRFDNFQPESIRFMAREITILRRLDHPNIMKLEGVITSRFSSTVYLVFEYMEHDLAGLSSCPDIKFSEAQVKCYMKQLLSGLEHCHLRGIMHRDIKASNILVNNQGVLKLGDFGLANILTSRNRQQLTSRVVTLWYRPPELLMGSTSYEVSVDLWSVGCVFAELLMGKPILKGRTEVEQLHKIFKLCGSPPDDYWKKTRLPHSTMFKPQHPYESCLRERCKDIPATAMNLLEALLSVEPHKRGTASSSLMSEYFHTKPYACDPSSLPKYSPNKEIDAKRRDELRRKKAGSRTRDSGVSKKTRRSRKALQEPNNFSKTAPKEELRDDTQFASKNHGLTANNLKGREGAAHKGQLNSSFFDTRSETSQVTTVSQGDIFTAPPPVTGSSSFSWAKKRKDSTSTLSYNQPSSISQLSDADSSSFTFSNSAFNLTKDGTQDVPQGVYDDWRQQKQQQNGLNSHGFFYINDQQVQSKFDRSDVFDASDVPQSHDYSMAFHQETAINNDMVKIDYSGPLVTGPYKVDELLQRNENHIRQVARRSRFHREK
ncbi:probable serine/threonine-protein kinase At1g54610 isoform X2 [Herrania umbratica]|uniref:Probable serine/threonine-protein kinase At1g54610 isoform X2 n=1 Tax=Herrania umbratica TaxID=108875 RepID=A0A6J1BGU3_9ROSI|nr:probable serine/threonine-protein kinase At1g54610 isoform X2 [Herrania umbratica]